MSGSKPAFRRVVFVVVLLFSALSMRAEPDPTPSPALAVSLSLETAEIFVGQTAHARSAAGPAGTITVHGVEARTLGGPWETLTEWDDGGGDRQIAFPSPLTAGIYEVRAYAARDDDDDFSYSPRALLTVSAIAPAITTQPAGAIAIAGESVTLSVAATGTALTYQWRKDGLALGGATNPSLAFSPAQLADSGSYTVAVANSAGTVTSRAAGVSIATLRLPAVGLEVWNFPGAGGRRTVALTAAHVGDVISVQAVANITAGAGWRHNVLIRRPAITTASALAPEDGSGLTETTDVWNKDGWGNPHTDGNSYDSRVAGHAAVDLGNREPFIHPLATGQVGSTRAFDFVLDAPGTWLIRTEVVDAAGQSIAVSATTAITVGAAPLTTDPGAMTYPYGRSDRFVGVYWNAGQAHRLWSTWRAEFQNTYRATWAVNWKLMWQPSPYFRAVDGSWLQTNPAAESPWQPFWSAHQVYAVVPDANGVSTLTHDLTSRAFAEKAALRLMDIGVDFVAIDYTNQFLEEREDVFPALNNLAQAFQAVALKSPSGEPIKMTAVVPANIASGDWAGSGGFGAVAIARFNAKLTTLYTRFAQFESTWFHLEDDNGVRKPLLLLWIGAGGEGEPDGTLAPAKLSQLHLTDGRALTDVFTVRWVGAYLSDNRRFLTGGSYTVADANGSVSGKLANAKMWSYHENFPAAAAIMPGSAGGPTPAIEAITVQPLAVGHDRFGRAWNQNWPANQAFHYETPATSATVPLENYGKTWRDALSAARALNPKFIMTTWAEFGSENDEPRPELSVTIMDNNKFGTHFGDAFKEAVRQFKYRAPAAWLDTFTSDEGTRWFVSLAPNFVPPFRAGDNVRLQGWVTPNVATAFAGGSVKIYIDDQLRGEATVGGAWNGATQWQHDLALTGLSIGRHTLKILAEDGVGGSALAGVQFHGEAPRNSVTIAIIP